MNHDHDLSWYLLRGAYHVVNVLLYFCIMAGGIGIGYLAWREFGQLGLNIVILIAAYLRLRHDIRAIQRGDLDPPSHGGDGGNADRREDNAQATGRRNPFGKSGRE